MRYVYAITEYMEQLSTCTCNMEQCSMCGYGCEAWRIVSTLPVSRRKETAETVLHDHIDTKVMEVLYDKEFKRKEAREHLRLIEIVEEGGALPENVKFNEDSKFLMVMHPTWIDGFYLKSKVECIATLQEVDNIDKIREEVGSKYGIKPIELI